MNKNIVRSILISAASLMLSAPVLAEDADPVILDSGQIEAAGGMQSARHGQHLPDGMRDRIGNRIDHNNDGVIGPKERRHAKRVFDRVDRNDDGIIGPRERRNARYVYNRIDVNDDGVIGPRERRYARQLRNNADLNGDGRLGKRERRVVRHTMNHVDRRH